MLTGKSQWKNGTFLNGAEKEELLKHICSIRDSPTEALYLQQEEKLLELTSELSVRAGQTVKYTTFKTYYDKNWNCLLYTSPSPRDS